MSEKELEKIVDDEGNFYRRYYSKILNQLNKDYLRQAIMPAKNGSEGLMYKIFDKSFLF
ncbi:MAG: hypothetical protein OQK82_04860 [Candidatus Pacearchaeota archaeon]|nr:hypothetical protein [Candidatus Pacearchaeota archaeon]